MARWKHLFLLVCVVERSFSWLSYESADISYRCIKERKLDASVSDTEDKLITSLLLHVSFDGKEFNGWSSANDPIGTSSKRSVRSVQGVLRRNIAQLYGNVDPTRVVVEGCSRTDKGVHARGHISQVYVIQEDMRMDQEGPEKRKLHPRNCSDTSNFAPLRMDLPKLAFCLNRMLPDDVRIIAIAESPEEFHPTVSALCKTYCYTVSFSKLRDPLLRHTTWHVPQFEHIDTLKQSQSYLGTQNFRHLEAAPRGSAKRAKNSTCTIHNITFTNIERDCVEIRVTGDRFLYKMVRRLVGALIQGPNVTAPAHGLVLESVKYGVDIDWIKANS